MTLRLSRRSGAIRVCLTALAAVVLCGCAAPRPSIAVDSAAAPARQDQPLTLFSASPAGDTPADWAALTLTRKKKPTVYTLVDDAGRTVLQAVAEQSSSGLRHAVDIDVGRRPWLSWSWKTAALIPGADITARETDDAPVRIVLAFDGDHDRLSLMDTILFDTARLLTGHELPYATLMYVWDSKAAVGSIVANSRTGRIQMLVVESGPAQVGRWRQYQRNVAEDYQRVFGEPPGRLIGVGVLTDADNTLQQARSWYGDIRLLREPAGVAR